MAMAFAAYLVWGFLPLYWPLLRTAGAFEILSQRIAWSMVLLVVLLAARGGFAAIRALGARRLGLLTVASLLVGFNWGFYIWAVNHRHVVETALGYFMNPLVSVLLGVFVLGERMRRAQWVAITIAGVAVLVLAVDHGRPPWIAISLASTFALYGLVKKRAAVPPLTALAVETGLLVAPAAGYLVWLEVHGLGSFGHVSRTTDALFIASGAVTAVPLLCFAGAANRIPLSTLGLIQYVSPTLQFLCGVLVFHEPMAAPRWAGFFLVWIALAVFVVDQTVRARVNAAGRSSAGSAASSPPRSR